ncbi:tumor necrosis factor receptor superfamily member 13C isoform X1 [Halichoerus grypus]|uniref:tumor necrosis factor receptor superfamily member 13C isoform X2 n=1 Tax=Halichoerus grypus TaxID=9711 RepID=UPI001659FA70|nr:tumor necrosis factor receptor superfamily member 13C isoform X2 [Halichoerus grypus]
MEEPQVEREGVGCRALGPWLRVVPPQQAGGWGGARWVVAPPGFLLWPLKPGSVPAGCERVPSMGSKRRGARSRQGRDGPAPTQCVQAECFDPLVRNCVACKLFRTPEPRPAAGASSLAPGTALQPQESVGPGAAAEAEAALPLPALLFGAPALLGLALALVLVGLLSWRWRRRRPHAAAPPGAPAPHPHEALDNVIILPPGPHDATTPVWPPTREDPANTPPAHSVPVPATELGSTELVTTKTAGPEQQ